MGVNSHSSTLIYMHGQLTQLYFENGMQCGIYGHLNANSLLYSLLRITIVEKACVGLSFSSCVLTRGNSLAKNTNR